MPLNLDAWNIDFAVWCSYKYLCAGPGAVGGLYVNAKYIRELSLIRFAGWWGQNKNTRFEMPKEFDPIPSAESWQLSNANVLSLAALRGALAIFDQVDLQELQAKNRRLVNYLAELLTFELGEIVQIISSLDPHQRGCQLSLHLESGAELEELLWQQGVVCDTRAPIIRVAPMGLYNTYEDVYEFVQRLKSILA